MLLKPSQPLSCFAVLGWLMLFGAVSMAQEAPPEPPATSADLPPEEVLPPPPDEPAPVEIPPPIDADPGPSESSARPPIGQPVPPKAKTLATPGRTVEKPSEDKVGADLVPDGQELVNIDFPEPTEIKDIIRAVSLWTGKNVILGRDVSGKVQMISPRKVTKVEAYQAFLSALNMLDLTTVETGKVIKIIKVNSAVRANLKTFLGSSWTPMTDEFITQIVPLKYINAKEIQTTLSRIVTSNAMIAYPPTNTLIISDTGYKVRRILDIIELLDVQTQQPKISIVPIRYGDAKAIAAMVQDIFKAQSTGGGAKSTSSYLSYKIMTDERTNAVVIFGPPATIADVKALVRKFDVRVDDPSRQSTIHVRPLDYADAKKLASTLSSLASGGRSAGGIRRPPGAPSAGRPASPVDSAPEVATFDNDVKITADESSNSLLVTGSRAAYDSLNTIIRKLDTRRSQVFVEAEILDINVSGGFGFSTSIFGGIGSEKGNKTAITWQAQKISPLIVSQAANTTDKTGISQAAQPFAEDLNIGILSGYQVNVPGIGKISPGALIKLIKSDQYTRVLSSPHILTSNNETAKISVGDKLFFKTTEISTSGTALEQVKDEKVELSLDLKPNISHSNYVTLKIDLDASSGKINDNNLPSILTRKTSQIVTVKNGQTVVISGLVKMSEFESYQKIPLLGDIPILGWLFRNSSIQKVKENLVIFLTPYIVHGANDLAAIYEKKIEERDEILSKLYGSDFKDDDFYRRLPTVEDGTYRADAFDNIDEKRKDIRDREMMRDLGYASEDVSSIADGNRPEQAAQPEDKPVEENLPKPSIGEDKDGVTAEPPVEQPSEQPETLEPSAAE